MSKIKIDVSYYVGVGDKTFSIDDEKLELLSYISKTGSINSAARETGISYRSAQSYIKRMESRLGIKLVKSVKGGKNGGYTSLNKNGQSVVRECKKMRAILNHQLIDKKEKF